jgi:hypothetical protein
MDFSERIAHLCVEPGPWTAGTEFDRRRLGVHAMAMLAVTAGTAFVVHDSARAILLRRRWLDHDRIRVAALLVTGAPLITGL